jgi:translation initiation factor 2 alpha subunit (eIF-2alpha)
MEYNANNRFYRNIFPSVGDIVKVKSLSVLDDWAGIKVILLEYGNLEANIPYKELSKYYSKNIRSITSENKVFNAEVININQDKNYIDLSNKHINSDDNRIMDEVFNKNSRVDRILKSVSIKSEIQKIDLYENMIWKISDDYDELHPDDFILDLYKQNNISKMKEFCKDDNIYEIFCNISSNYYKSEFEFELISKIDINCFNINGIDDIKDGLNYIKSKYPKIKINLETSPTFVFKLITDDTYNKEYFEECINSTINHFKGIEGCETKLKHSSDVH